MYAPKIKREAIQYPSICERRITTGLDTEYTGEKARVGSKIMQPCGIDGNVGLGKPVRNMIG